MSDSSEARAARRPRRDKRSAANRERLLQSALEIVVDNGAAAATMVAITKRAGLHPPAFYVHFKNVDECIAAAARLLWEQQREVSTELRALILNENEGASRDELELQVIERSLRGILEHAQVYRVFLRSMQDPGPIGDVAREEREIACKELTEYLWRLAIAAGVDVEHLLELQATARHLVNLYFAAATDLTEGRARDVSLEAQRIDRYARTVVVAELRRMKAN